MSVYKKLLGQTAVYGLATVASRVLNFFLTPLYVRVFSEYVYGIFTYVYSWASIVNAILAFGMETTYFRFLNREQNKKEQVYANAFLCVALLTVIFVTTSFFFSDSIAGALFGPERDGQSYALFVKLFVWILLADNLCAIPFAKLRAEGRPMRYGLLKFINVSVFIALNLFFLLLMPLIIKNQWPGYVFLTEIDRGNWVGYVFIANLVASLVTLLLLLPEILTVRLRFDIPLFKKMLLYSWPVLIANLSFIINENIDKIYLENLLPAEISTREVGIYGACYKLAIFLNIMIQAFRLGAEPFFFNHAKHENARQTYATIMYYFVLVLSVTLLALVANLGWLQYFVVNDKHPEYAEGISVVPILLFAYVFLGIYMNLSIWYKLSDKTRYGFYISGAGALITLTLNPLLIPYMGYMGSALVTLLAYFVMAMVSYFWGQQHYPIPYNVKKTGLWFLSATVLAILAFYVFDGNIWIGNALLLIYLAAILLLEKNNLLKLLKNIS